VSAENVGGDLLENLKRIAPKVRANLREAAVNVAKRKLLLSQERVPYKSGDLHDSGRVSVRAGSVDNTISIKISYGSSSVPYAVRVHEDLQAKHRGQRRAKFLESVMQEADMAAEVYSEFKLADCL
jgi:hypothetical protein